MNQISTTLNSFSVLNKKEKIGVSILLLVSVINSLIQTLGLISIMPFIALIADPSIAQNNSYILIIKDLLSIESHQSLLVLFASITFLALLVSNAVIVINYWASLDFFNRIGSKLSNQLLTKYLSKSLQSFNISKISEISKNINSEVDRVIIGTQLSVMSLISDIITLTIIFILLLFINIWVSIITAIALLFAYFLVYNFLSNRIDKLGKEFDKMETLVYSNLRQALDLFREIKISGKKSFFTDNFSLPNDTLYKNSTRYHVIKFLPIQLVELLAFAVILSISTYISIIQPDTVNAITTISIFAFAAYRFIPILKSIFDELEEIVYASSALGTLLNEFASPISKNDISETNDSLILLSDIHFEQLSFKYETSKTQVLNNIDFKITNNLFTCITGQSGIGKSTLLDLLLGLLTAQSGAIRLDGIQLEKSNMRAWQNNIGYVPQHIQLVEGTIADNICFGINKQEIDTERLKKVCQIANIDELIEHQLKEGYETIIGNGGKSLSGGEKQRIGIARSLYHDPQILIFDEATNELDIKTEDQIITEISKLEDKTIIFVTHKPSIMKKADMTIDLSLIASTRQEEIS